MAVNTLFALAALLPLVATQCFFLDGTQVSEPDFVPCNPTTGGLASMCCGVNRAPQRSGLRLSASSSPPDLCLSNGLCQVTGLDRQGNQRVVFARESCSRRDWVGCLKNVCPSITGSDTVMTACGQTNQTVQWCCGDNNAACCSRWPNHPDAAAIPLQFNTTANSAGGSRASPSPSIGSFTVIGPSPTAQTIGNVNPTQAPFSNPTDSADTPGPTGSVDDPSSSASAALDPSAAPDVTGTPGLVPSASGLSTQAIAGVAAGVVVVVVVLVTVGCFTAESLYKKRNRIFRTQRRGSMKERIRLGWDRDSPERATQIA